MKQFINWIRNLLGRPSLEEIEAIKQAREHVKGEFASAAVTLLLCIIFADNQL